MLVLLSEHSRSETTHFTDERGVKIEDFSMKKKRFCKAWNHMHFHGEKKDPIHKQREGGKKEKEKDLIEFYVIITDFFFLQYHIK